jgi:hypothetical protein
VATVELTTNQADLIKILLAVIALLFLVIKSLAKFVRSKLDAATLKPEDDATKAVTRKQVAAIARDAATKAAEAVTEALTKATADLITKADAETLIKTLAREQNESLLRNIPCYGSKQDCAVLVKQALKDDVRRIGDQVAKVLAKVIASKGQNTSD